MKKIKHIKHTLKGIAATKEVFLDGKLLIPSKKHKNFKWGYGAGFGDSDPANLAYAIMMAISGKPNGYILMKWEVIYKLSEDKDFEVKFG